MKPPLLLFVVTEDRYFLSHRLPMARAAQAAGFRVGVVTRVTVHAPAIAAAGIEILPFDFARGSLNPFAALRNVARLAWLYRAQRPQAVHHIALQPILYGGIFTNALGDAQNKRVVGGVANAAANLPGDSLVAAFQNHERRTLIRDPRRRGVKVAQFDTGMPRLSNKCGDAQSPHRRRTDDEDRLTAFQTNAPERRAAPAPRSPDRQFAGTRGGALETTSRKREGGVNRSVCVEHLPLLACLLGPDARPCFRPSVELGSRHVAAIAQLVRALDCGSRGPPFEPGWWYVNLKFFRRALS